MNTISHKRLAKWENLEMSGEGLEWCVLHVDHHFH